MDSQLVINAAFGLISFLGGWVIRMMWSRNNNIEQDVDDLQRHHDADLKEVRKEMADLALSMPEKYVSKQDLDKLEDFINERFNKLEVKLDQLKG
tara:strand:+ start:7563 stop:7847 length:285 start_codon:yes stop_codon:yes gene_type:complete